MSNRESRSHAENADSGGMDQEWPEAGVQAAIQLLRASHSGGMSVIDVGAHYGETMRSLFRACPKPLHYAGFEPNPEAFALFQASAAELAGKDCSIECIQAAAGSRKGTIKFLMTKESAVSGILKAVDGLNERVPSGDHKVNKEIEVPLETMDSVVDRLAWKKVDLLKIDAEGFDLEVLRGARDVLDSQKAGAVMTEVFFVPYRVGQAYFWDIATFMSEKKYHFVNLYDTRNTSQGRLYTGNALWVSSSVAKANAFL